MKRLADLMPQIAPETEGDPLGSGDAVAPDDPEFEMVHALGADLPSGHLHVWAGPAGAGKTALLLGMLHAAATHGRTVALATYDLPGSTLALRLLAMAAGVPSATLLGGRGPDDRVPRGVARVRDRLAALPFFLLEARGMGVASLQDRLVRAPARPDVLGIDHLRGVVRPAGGPPVLQALSELAVRLHVAVVSVDRSTDVTPPPPPDTGADRVGWIAPAGAPGTCEASLVANRHGRRVSRRMRIDAESGRLRPEA